MSPGREEVYFALNEQNALAYDFPADPEGQQWVPAAVLDWAGGGDAERVEAAVHQDTLRAEDAVLVLAAAFGAFPVAELSDRTSGPDV